MQGLSLFKTSNITRETFFSIALSKLTNKVSLQMVNLKSLKPNSKIENKKCIINMTRPKMIERRNDIFFCLASFNLTIKYIRNKLATLDPVIKKVGEIAGIRKKHARKSR